MRYELYGHYNKVDGNCSRVEQDLLTFSMSCLAVNFGLIYQDTKENLDIMNIEKLFLLDLSKPVLEE